MNARACDGFSEAVCTVSLDVAAKLLLSPTPSTAVSSTSCRESLETWLDMSVEKDPWFAEHVV
jgi:hypothetical protein